MSKDYTINLYTKDGKFIRSIDFVKLFSNYHPELKILDIKRIGNRSILLATTESNTKKEKLIKVKGVGVEKYDYHYANTTDKLYNQFVAKTDIKYMRYKVNNPKLNMITRRNIIVVDLPYQDFIGEPIGGCGAKELRARKIYQQLLDISVVSVTPISYVNIFIDNKPIYLVFYDFRDKIENADRTLQDLLEEYMSSNNNAEIRKRILKVFEQVAKTMKVFYQSGIIVPKDKNIVADISYSGLYNDLADTYIQESDTKYHFFGTLYNLFRLSFYEYTNLYKDTEFMSKIYRLFLDTFTFTDTKHFPPSAIKNNKKEEKKKQRIERKIIKELDEIKIAYLVGRILDLKFPTAREQKHFLQQKLGGNISRYEVGDKLALTSYWLLDKYYHYNKSLEEMF